MEENVTGVEEVAVVSEETKAEERPINRRGSAGRREEPQANYVRLGSRPIWYENTRLWLFREEVGDVKTYFLINRDAPEFIKPDDVRVTLPDLSSRITEFEERRGLVLTPEQKQYLVENLYGANVVSDDKLGRLTDNSIVRYLKI